MAIDMLLVVGLRIKASEARRAVELSGVPELDAQRLNRADEDHPASWNLDPPATSRVRELLLVLWRGGVIHLEGWTVGPHRTATGGQEGYSVIRWAAPTPSGEVVVVVGEVFEAALVAAQLEEWRA